MEITRTFDIYNEDDMWARCGEQVDTLKTMTRFYAHREGLEVDWDTFDWQMADTPGRRGYVTFTSTVSTRRK